MTLKSITVLNANQTYLHSQSFCFSAIYNQHTIQSACHAGIKSKTCNDLYQ